MRLVFLFCAAAAVAAPASAGVVMYGDSTAYSCYRLAASEHRITPEMLRPCHYALSDDALSRFETMATHVNRGIVLERMGRVEEAIRDLDRAIALEPGRPEGYLNKAALLVRARKYEDALPLFEAALERKTQRPALAYYGRAIAHEELGRIPNAYRDYSRASQLDPEWEEPRRELARFSVARN